MESEAKGASRYRLRFAPHLCALAVALFASEGDALNASDDLSPRKARIENLTPDEKQQLWRRYERFHMLSSAEQERLRSLDAQLDRDPDGARLRRVMESYQRWLEQLSSAERAELTSLDPDERFKRIAQRRAEEARRLGPEDAQAFARWFEALLAKQRPAIAALLEPIESEADRRAQVRRIVESYLARGDARRPPPPAGPGGARRLASGPDDFARLRDSLSEKARRQLDAAAGPLERRQLINGWVRQIYGRGAGNPSLRLAPVPSEERLRKFFDEELDSSQRAWLLSLPLEQMQRQLRQLYGQRHPPVKPGTAPASQSQ